VAAPVSLRNLAATVLELVDADRSALPGRSLARFWRGDDVTPDTIVTSVRQVQNQPAWYPASQGDLNSIAFDGWRYIRNEGTGTEELYDFETDLLEHRNVAASPEGQARLPRYRAAIAALKPAAPGRRLARP
jgi:arylsulfatase A-like enzyme